MKQATLATGGGSTSSDSTSSTATAPGEEGVALFQDMLAYYCGFFVTEHIALRATEHPEGLLPLARLEEAWAGIQREVCLQLEARAAMLANPLHIIQVWAAVATDRLLACLPAFNLYRSSTPPLQLKQTALLVAFTLGEDCFRFNTQPLIDTVRGLRIRYHQVRCRPPRPRPTVSRIHFITSFTFVLCLRPTPSGAAQGAGDPLPQAAGAGRPPPLPGAVRQGVPHARAPLRPGPPE